MVPYGCSEDHAWWRVHRIRFNMAKSSTRHCYFCDKRDFKKDEELLELYWSGDYFIHTHWQATHRACIPQELAYKLATADQIHYGDIVKRLHEEMF
jgi:hypothetical protein